MPGAGNDERNRRVESATAEPVPPRNGQGMIPRYLKSRTVLVAALSLAALQPAQAQLFGDNEARRAILDLRERYQGMQQEMTGMRSSVQRMQGQIDTLQTELARSRGREEQLTRGLNSSCSVADLARAMTEQPAAAPAAPAPRRLRQPPPSQRPTSRPPVSEADDGQDVFDAALAHFRKANYARAQDRLPQLPEPVPAWRRSDCGTLLAGRLRLRIARLTSRPWAISRPWCVRRRITSSSPEAMFPLPTARSA